MYKNKKNSRTIARPRPTKRSSVKPERAGVTNNRKIVVYPPLSAPTYRTHSSELLCSTVYKAYVTCVDLNRLSFEGMRLSKLMDLYEFWFVHSMTLRYVPTVAKTQAGTIHLAVDYDPIDPPPDPAEAPNVLASMMGGISIPLCEEGQCYVPNIRLPGGEWARPTLFTSPIEDPRLSTYGRAEFFISGATTNGGSLYLDYDITFAVPQLDFEAATVTDISDMNITLNSVLDDSGIGELAARDGGGFDVTPSANYNLDSTAMYSGLLDTSSTATCSCDGELLPAGTPLWVKAARWFYSAAAGTIGALGADDLVGGLFLDAAQQIPVLVSGAAAGIIVLDRVRKFLF